MEQRGIPLFRMLEMLYGHHWLGPSMADDPQRNFRSAYYEKVGFRGVEEKKSLEILLKDNPLGTLTSAVTRNVSLNMASMQD